MKSVSRLLAAAVVLAMMLAIVADEPFAYTLKQMVADFERPYIYAIQSGASGSQDSLLFIDVASERVVKTIPIGPNVTDMAINYGEGRLYVTNWMNWLLRVVDLATQTEVTSFLLGQDIYKVNAGRPGRIYYEGQNQWVYLKVIETTFGGVAGSLYPIREGDAEIAPTGAYYYHCDNNSSTARIHKYDIRTDNPVQVATSNQHPYGSRNLVLSGDGSRLFWRGYVYDANLEELGYLGSEIYETTLHGDLAFGSTTVYNTSDGASIYALPFSTTVMALSGDQEKLFLFNPGTGAWVVVPVDEIAEVLGPGLNPDPADGSTVVLPLAELGWDISPGALSYDVYFGTDWASVDNAVTSSPEYLGEATENNFDLSIPLTLGQTYYWRVDEVGFSTTTKGTVWSFDVAPVVVDPKELATKTVTGGPLLEEALIITSNGGAETWSVSESIPWLSVGKSGGLTPDTAIVTMDVSGLSAGVYRGVLQFESGASEFDVPVDLELFNMALSRMVADMTRPYIYALHPGSGNFGDAFLLFVNTESEQVERVIPIGTNPTDMTIHYGEGRLYVTNWKHGFTRVVDLATQKELAPLSLGKDVWKINAGRLGRIYCEGEDQWVSLRIIDTATGGVVGSLNVREGDAEISPTGAYYYHCDDNISTAAIHKYDIQTDSPVQVAASNQHELGSRNLVLSKHGTRLFWQGYVFDENLNELGYLGSEIYETTLLGDLAFGSTTVYNTGNGASIYTLPFSTTVMALSGDQEKLFLFNPGTGGLVVIPMGEILPVPVFINSFSAVSSAAGVELTWEIVSDENVKGFRIYRSGEGMGAAELLNRRGLIPAGVREYVDEGIRSGRSYEYTLAVVFTDNSEVMSQTVTVKTKVYQLILQQNHPNPFNPSTTISFTLPEKARVTLSVYDVQGRLMRTLMDVVVGEGNQERTWDGKDASGNQVGSGVYFYRLTAGDKTLTKKMVMIR